MNMDTLLCYNPPLFFQVTMHAVPRLSESGTMDTGVTMPALWSVFDVCQFLRINDCAQHCDTFRKRVNIVICFLDLSVDQLKSLECFSLFYYPCNYIAPGSKCDIALIQ